MTQRAALYARVSTASQEREQTVASQIEALEGQPARWALPCPQSDATSTMASAVLVIVSGDVSKLLARIENTSGSPPAVVT